MRSKKVTRYYCEFCKKGGFFASRMEKHEKGCTANLARECGFCRSMGERQLSLDELKAVLAKDISLDTSHGLEYLKIDNLRTAANHCPACILFAIRHNEGGVLSDFNFSDEVSVFWKEHNDSREVYGTSP